ncbi:hypothetical protein TNCV_4017991 [Trichonephila clavipes]|nr:hypothetical protein TNCV_4017991 [Trichonephila clavipes]
MITLWLLQQFQHDIDNFFLQLKVASPHWSAEGRDYLNEHLSFSPMDMTSRVLQDATYPMAFRSPDLTHRDLFQ